MKLTLSKREGFLLFAAAFLAIFVLLFQFAILPAYNAYQAKQTLYQERASEKTILDAKIAGEAFYITQNEAHHAKLDEIKAVYPSAMRNEQIDNVLTGLCVSNGLEPISLSLSAVKNDPPPNTENVNTENAPQEVDPFLVVAAKMTADGSVEQLLQLLDRVEAMAHIRISRLSFYDHAGTGDHGKRSITLHFEVTMLRDIP